MDGVPYLTQFPIAPDEAFDYGFTPPDAGTYWYHPHCMTMDQMALGLTGVIIVDEHDDPGFDLEVILNLRDFRLGDDGEWLDLWTPRGAARGGTLGTVMTANWRRDPVHDAPAGGLVRLRLAATDTTRIYRIFVPGMEGRVIAWDGHPLRVPVDVPTEAAPHVLAPGQRLDLALRMPGSGGRELAMMTATPGGARRVARIRALGVRISVAICARFRPCPPTRCRSPTLIGAHGRIRLRLVAGGRSTQQRLLRSARVHSTASPGRATPQGARGRSPRSASARARSCGCATRARTCIRSTCTAWCSARSR